MGAAAVRRATVIVVGGGASGLSTAAALSRRGIEAVVLDQDGEVGGTWLRRYDRLRLHTVRRLSGLAHFPIGRHYPTYLSRDDVVAYLREYVRHFALRVQSGVTVTRIRPGGAPGGDWRAETAAGDSWHARAVVIATGQHRQPTLPAWPGAASYAGRLLHSSAYCSALPYHGSRVLVVGCGNSGAEIAADLAADGTTDVSLSVRTPPSVVPRDPFGFPVQPTSILLSALPPAIANLIAAATSRLTVGDLTPYGLPRAGFVAYTARHIPLIDVGFVDALRGGHLRVKAAVTALTETGATFVDGSRGDYDVIVAATGFTTGLACLLGPGGVLDESGMPRDEAGEPTARPGLYFVGFTRSLRGHLFEANRASRRAARNVERYLTAVEPAPRA